MISKTLADKSLGEYERDLVIKTSVGFVPVFKFIEKFLWIRTKNGSITRFILNEEQIDLYKDICLIKREKEPIRINILKARQLGFSTFIAAIFFCLTIFSPNKRAIIVADTAEHASNLFDKYKLFYERLPNELKIPKKASNAKMLIVDYGNGCTSEIKIVCQGDNAARSDTAQFLHCSESAFWEDLRGTMASLNQVVDITNPDSFIIFETTGNGYNDYKTKWDRDYGGNSDYKAKFYPWWGNPNYKAFYTGFDYLPHEEELRDKLHLSEEQIAWYRLQYNAVEGDLGLLRQEYPSTPQEAFITTGASLFPLELINKRKEEIHGVKFQRGLYIWDKKIVSEQGDVINLINPKFSKSSTGLITIFEEAKRGHPYIVNVDPAMGGEDNFVAQVFDNNTCRQVAKLSINHCTDFEWLGYQIYCLTRNYNNALLNAECNNTTGTFVLEIAEKCGHNFIYQDNSPDTISDHFEDKRGYKTKTTNREFMINLTVKAFRDNYQMINDWDTLCEMENFQIIKKDNGKEKAEATKGHHDDHVTALFGIFLARRSMLQTTLVDEKAHSRQLTIEELQEERYQIFKEEKEMKNRIRSDDIWL